MNPSGESTPESPIQVYLDDLLDASRGMRPREVRELLAEAEAHLYDDKAALIAGGTAEYQAEVEAVARFGPPGRLAAADRDRSTTPSGKVLRQVVVSGVRLGSIGAIAVGVSGAIAGLFWIVGGSRAVIDVPAGRILAPGDCARWLAGEPGAGSCRAAAINDWAAETVFYRIALGLLGVLALLGLRWLERRRTAMRGLDPLVSDTIAATIFGVAGAWTLGLGVDAIVSDSGRGSGQWFSAALVSVVAFGYYAARLLTRLRRRPAG
jgi:hypothetical protein